MHFQSYFNTAIKIIRLYDGTVPLHHFLKRYFSQHKKHGSRDRKMITHACYNFYRLGKGFIELDIEKKLSIAIFICNNDPGGWNFLYDDEWLNNRDDLLINRLQFVKKKYDLFSLNDVFPFADQLSEDLDVPAFIQSFLTQPNVFVRIRPGYGSAVISKLQQKNIPFGVIDENCIAFSPFVNIETMIDIDKEAVIQDYSSQRIKEFLKLIETGNRTSDILHPTSVWDCCAGSGGKSILAYDVLKSINLAVSDVRPSILQNLKERFAKAGIKNYKSFITDLTKSKFRIPNSTFDLVICDAPCTGSGTWSRTPEQLYFFQQKTIEAYTSLQQKIVSRASSLLKTDGYFLYITCSVFKQENEAVVSFIENRLRLKLIQKELLKGYNQKADTLFGALFIKTT